MRGHEFGMVVLWQLSYRTKSPLSRLFGQSEVDVQSEAIDVSVLQSCRNVLMKCPLRVCPPKNCCEYNSVYWCDTPIFCSTVSLCPTCLLFIHRRTLMNRQAQPRAGFKFPDESHDTPPPCSGIKVHASVDTMPTGDSTKVMQPTVFWSPDSGPPHTRH